MKTAMLSTLAISCSAILHAYDIEQFVKDTQGRPERIYRKLHPEAKAYVDRGIELYRTNEAFRQEKFVEFEDDPSQLKPAKIWRTIWTECGYDEIYANGYRTLNTFDEGDWRYVTVQELGFPEEVRMVDTFVFRKGGDEYLLYPPGWVMEYFSPIDDLSGSDDPLSQTILEQVIKQRIEENITEEDKEAFRNAKSPEEVSKLFQKIMEGSSEHAEESDPAK